jgi:hypothetical protein
MGTQNVTAEQARRLIHSAARSNGESTLEAAEGIIDAAQSFEEGSAEARES